MQQGLAKWLAAKHLFWYLQWEQTGEIEDAVKETGIHSINIMRPSVLLGDRKEKRLAESISKKIMSVFSFLVPSKYKAIHGRTVAKAMKQAAKENKQGFFIHEYKEIKTKAK